MDEPERGEIPVGFDSGVLSVGRGCQDYPATLSLLLNRPLFLSSSKSNSTYESLVGYQPVMIKLQTNRRAVWISLQFSYLCELLEATMMDSKKGVLMARVHVLTSRLGDRS